MKTKYKIFILITVIFILLSLLLFYINTSLIPVKLKNILETKISNSLQHKITIDNIKFSLIKGLVIYGIKIYQPDKDSSFLLTAKSISMRPIFIPSFKKHRIIIPTVTVDSANIKLIRSSDGAWNISELFQEKYDSNKESKLSIIVKSISLNSGNILFEDNYNDIEFKKSINDIEATVGLSLPDTIKIKSKALIDSTPINIVAKYTLASKTTHLDIKTSSMDITEYAKTYLPKDIGLLYSGIVNADMSIETKQFKDIRFNGKLSLKNIRASSKGIDIEGNYHVAGSGLIDTEDIKNSTYNIKAEVDSTNIKTNNRFITDINDISLHANLSQKNWSIKDLSCKYHESDISINANIDKPHTDYSVKMHLATDLVLNKISDSKKLKITDGITAIDADIQYNKDRSYSIKGNSNIKNLILKQEDLNVKGNFLINGSSSGTIDDFQSLKYKGNITFTDTTIKGPTTIPIIEKASGEATFSTRLIELNKLKAEAAGAEISLEGKLDYTKGSPNVEIKLKTGELSLLKLIDILPGTIKAKLQNYDLSGRSYANMHFTGILKQPETYTYKGDISIKDGLLRSESIPYDISNINSKILFKDQQITWKESSFKIKEKTYHTYGTLSNLAAFNISATLKSNDIDLMLETKTDRNGIINILNLKGRYLSSLFSVSGSIDNLKNAYSNLAGEINFDVKDLPEIFKDKKQSLDKMKPSGNIKIEFDLVGPLKDPTRWRLFAEGNSSAIYLNKLKLNDLYIDYRMKDGFIDLPVIVAYPYGGIINMNVRSNLNAQEQPYAVNIDIKDVDLRKLIEESDSKNKKIKGLLSAKTALNGYLKKENSLKGKGWLQVSDGYLWEFPVVHGIMDVILMVPPEYLTLTDAFGNFAISNNRVYTEDFKLLSKTASLLWVGSLGFDSTLDFDITGRFAEDVVKKTSEPGRIANAILHEAGSLIMEIRLTGTLEKPNYKIVPFPLKRIFKEKIGNAINDIFGNILE